MSTLRGMEDAILKMVSESSGPTLEALLVHEDDMDKMKQVLEETENTHPAASEFLNRFDCGVKVYKWDGSERLKRKFGGMVPESGKPIASYGNTLQRMAQEITKRRGGGT